MTSPRRHEPQTDARVWDWLYGLVGAGMWAFSTARFEVEVAGGGFPTVTSGQLWVSTHRAETDAPLLAGLMYVRGGMWRPGAARVHFAARDDLFQPGVVTAGLPLPAALGRLAWPLSPGRWLPRVRVHPVRRPTGAKLGQLIEELPDELPLGDLLGPRLTALVRDRAGRRRAAPRVVGDIRGPSSARLLWEDVDGADLTDAGQEVWRRHIARAAGDLRRIVRVVRDGESLLLFPEGRVSPDGGIGPVGDILPILVRAGRVASIVPVAIAYDPLRPRRTAVTVAVGGERRRHAVDLAAETLSQLRRLTPVTCGQLVSRVLVEAAAAGEGRLDDRGLRRALDAVVERALDERRPLASALVAEPSREARLAGALESLRSRRCVTSLRGGSLTIDPRRILAEAAVLRLAEEDRAVWARDEPGPSSA